MKRAPRPSGLREARRPASLAKRLRPIARRWDLQSALATHRAKYAIGGVGNIEHLSTAPAAPAPRRRRINSRSVRSIVRPLGIGRRAVGSRDDQSRSIGQRGESTSAIAPQPSPGAASRIRFASAVTAEPPIPSSATLLSSSRERAPSSSARSRKSSPTSIPAIGAPDAMTNLRTAAGRAIGTRAVRRSPF